MMGKFIRRAAILLLALLTLPALAASTCKGRFPNPVSDYCWSCVFPISIAGAAKVKYGQEDNNTTGSGPLCTCSDPPKVGLLTSFWEPVRMVDVTRTAYCFVGLGGQKMDFGIDAPNHTQNSRGTANANYAFYQAHWYINPMMFWLEVLMDNDCLERGVFDLAYVTEVDPLWADSELSFIINPDVVLWANPVAQMACTADCIASNFGFGRDELFWCNGCQGSMYPLNGWIGSKVGAVQATSLITARLTAKLHRELLIWAAAGDDGRCGYYPQPAMTKSNYKYHMLYPIPQTKKILGRCCQPFGRSTALWGAGKEFPVKGEDFAYQIYRKRDCCAGNLTKYMKELWGG